MEMCRNWTFLASFPGICNHQYLIASRCRYRQWCQVNRRRHIGGGVQGTRGWNVCNAASIMCSSLADDCPFNALHSPSLAFSYGMPHAQIHSMFHWQPALVDETEQIKKLKYSSLMATGQSSCCPHCNWNVWFRGHDIFQKAQPTD